MHPKMLCVVGWHLLPLVLMSVTFGTFITTYTISVINALPEKICSPLRLFDRRDASTSTSLSIWKLGIFSNDSVVPFFPYISDTGNEFPQSCFFTFGLNLSAFFAFACMYVRWRQVSEYNQDSTLMLRMNNWALGFGVAACLGMMLVAAFQDNATGVAVMHFIGAFMIFGLGVVYELLHTVMTFKDASSAGMKRRPLRVILTLLTAAALLVTIVAASISNKERGQGLKPGNHWSIGQPGFVPHVISTFAEWTMGITFLLFFLTYMDDFVKLSMRVQISLVIHDQYLEIDNGSVNGQI